MPETDTVPWSDDDTCFVVALLHAEGVGRKTIQLIKKSLIKHETTWKEFWVSPQKIMDLELKNRKTVTSMSKYIKETDPYSLIKALSLREISIVPLWSSAYPLLLKKTADPPLILFVKGDVSALQKMPAIAVVGTRKVSSYGKSVTVQLVKEFVACGSCIISGGMYGVDWCAHLTALAAGGSTVAVLGYGFDYSYPRHLATEFEKYLGKGLTLVSEFPPPVAPTPGNFPSRNRIVAGISQATVVCEAAQGSGSLITAACALDEGRSVGVVPCALTSPFVFGVKQLVNQGAILVTCAQDILSDSLSLEVAHTQLLLDDTTSLLEKLLIEILKQGVADTDFLIETAQHPLGEVVSALQLLCEKRVISRDGDLWCLLHS